MPDRWTVERVCSVLVDECRRAPDGLPIQLPVRYVPGAAPPLPHASWGQIEERLNWRVRFFSKETLGDWIFLLAWAQCKASGESISARIRGMGYKRTAFEQGRRRAARVISEGLNARRSDAA
jgi:hypothetical protein